MRIAICIFLLLAFATAGAQPENAPAGFQATEEILIPAGTFTMGSETSGKGYETHPVSLSAFYIDKYEVTNAQWQAFCEATDRKLPVFWGLERFHCGAEWPDHPVVGVSHGQARAYAAWVDRRLPTEAEWEFAARGGLEGQKYDTGSELADDAANTKSAKLDGTTPVGSFAPNGYGLYDMVGNVREWAWDNYSDDYFASCLAGGTVENPQGPESSNWRVIKGGGWFSGKGCNQVHVRNALPQSWSDFNVGFRCARDAEGD